MQDIYDEWSYGRRDPEAIRSFLTYAYRCWNGGPCAAPPAMPPNPPQYVLLVGDGHYNFQDVSGITLPNLIPPYLVHVDPWRGEVPADNRFVSADGPDDFLPDMAIGRVPARTAVDVAAVVDKVIGYETAAPGGAWQERVVFAADNNLDPSGDFHDFSDDVRLNWLPGGYDDRTIYYNRDYFSAGAMNTAIRNAFDADALMVQWFGHGNIVRWGSVQVFTIFDPPAMQANDTWPFLAAYTCLTGSFVYIGAFPQSLAEVLLMTPQRGSVAVLAPSGLHIGGALTLLNKGVVQSIFEQRMERAGQAVDAAKLYYFGNTGSFLELVDTFIFFGDPALKLRLPEPLLTPSSLVANRDWAPPGMPITVTATLSSTAALSTTAQLTVTLPAELGDPTTLTASSFTASYDPQSRQVRWDGVVTPGLVETVSWRSVLSPGLSACSQVTISGQARDGLAARMPLEASLQIAAPDVDCDGDMDIVDIQQITARWGAARGDPAYHQRYDLDGDDQIGVLDVIIVASHWQ